MIEIMPVSPKNTTFCLISNRGIFPLSLFLSDASSCCVCLFFLVYWVTENDKCSLLSNIWKKGGLCLLC